MALSGVRSSWLIVDRNAPLARFASSAARRAASAAAVRSASCDDAARSAASLSRSRRSARARSSASQQRWTTVTTSSTSAAVHARGVRWCTAMAATKRPALCSGTQMTARIWVAS
jgi:hypothetical protein